MTEDSTTFGMSEAAYREQWMKMSEGFWDRTAMGHLGMELVDVSDEQIVLRMPISDAVRQPYGLLHGGASLLMAESAASAHASWKVDFTQKMPVGVEINGSHLASAREGHVRATATVLRRSRAFIFHEVDITHEESGKLLCRARVTNYYKPVG
ncbi:MAG: PaaI family thioesterase [Anaerolineales bacterium]|nr:PaaI family thioesterase [Anaerolineales bacterium]MCB9128620.1 PaaI family thioesterase [Ardenticatenales bacterium]MCB9172558.1 PaaI family thioesterase [Ardenticatenales bacterium]